MGDPSEITNPESANEEDEKISETKVQFDEGEDAEDYEEQVFEEGEEEFDYTEAPHPSVTEFQYEEEEEGEEEEYIGEEEQIPEDEEVYGAPEVVEDIKLEIPNLLAFSQSLTELDESFGSPKKAEKKVQITAPVQKKKEKKEGEEGEDEDIDEIEEPEAEKPAKKAEGSPTGSEDDIELFGQLETEEEKPKEVKKVEVVVDLFEELGVAEFLDNLIENVVHKSEEIDHNAILRSRLDRTKILRAFKIGVTEIQEENAKRFVLHKKIVEYFRRKKYQRALAEDKIDTLLETMKRYKVALKLLDVTMAHESALKVQLQKKLQDFSSIEEQLRKEAEVKIETLNKRLKEIGLATISIKTGQPMSEKVVESIIRKMNYLRNQISQLRLTFIKAQHRIAVLNNEARKLEDIGQGLKMIDYEALLAEAQGLGDKVEEKNNELNRIRDRCNADTHFMSHIKEKQFMLSRLIAQHDSILQELKATLNDNRAYLSDLKIERDAIRRKHSDLSYQCGILDKMNLLYDYDITMERVEKTEAEVEDLRQAKKDLLNEVNSIIEKIG